MLGNPTMIPSVQVGAGIPLQSTTSVVGQSTLPQTNMAPQLAGSMLQVPPGTMVPVQVGNSIVMAPTQPVQTQSVVQTTIAQPEYQIQSYQPPVETEYIPPMENVVPAPQYQQYDKPMLKTLEPRIVRNELPPQYKTVTLPAKIVTQRLPPIGPPPTPELNIPLPPVEPVPIPEPVAIPAPVQSVQQYQSVMVPQVRTVMVPQVKTVMMPQTQVSMMPQYQTTSIPVANYQTASIGQLGQPKFGSTSVIAQY